MRFLFNKQAGFTLVEMIMVIVITGIIGGMVAVFLKAPIQQYMDVARRAELTDIADTAIRRMARDVRIAVPNSVRTAACTPLCVEFLPTKDGGRYRAAQDCTGVCTGDVLNFGTPDPSFDIVGRGITFADRDQIVVGSTQSDGNLPYTVNSAAASGVLSAVTGPFGTERTNVTITNAYGLSTTAQLDSQRFDVVDGPQQAVTYACETSPAGGACGTDASGNGTCVLRRYWGYGFNAAQATPVTIAAGAHTHSLLADRVSACTIDYDVVNQRFGLLAVRLTLTSNNESVSLYNEIHVNNLP